MLSFGLCWVLFVVCFVLLLKVPLLTGIKFHLRVHHPYLPLTGLFNGMKVRACYFFSGAITRHLALVLMRYGCQHALSLLKALAWGYFFSALFKTHSQYVFHEPRTVSAFLGNKSVRLVWSARWNWKKLKILADERDNVAVGILLGGFDLAR